MTSFGFYLSSTQTRQTRAISKFCGEFPKPHDAEELEALAQSLCQRLDKCGFDDLCKFRSCNPQVNARVAEALRGYTGLESSVIDLPVGADDRDRFIRALVRISFPGVRTAHQLLSDGLVVAARHPCVDYATMLLAVLRFHDLPCRYVHVFNIKMGSHTATTEVMIGGRLLMVRQSPQYDHKVWFGLLEQNMDIPPNPMARVIRAKDCFDTGMDVRKLSLLCYFSSLLGLDCRQIHELAVAGSPPT